MTEKNEGLEGVVFTNVSSYVDLETTHPVPSIAQKFGFLKKIRHFEHFLETKLGVEVQGIDRIEEAEKQNPGVWNIIFLWFSLMTHIANVPIGMVGPSFGLSLQQSIGSILVGVPLGALCTAFCATLSVKTGLRQVTCARYAFGFHGTKICSILNIVVLVGFAVINVVVAGQILSAVSDFHVPDWVGCIIVAAISYIVSLFGFRVILIVERYAWIIIFVLMMVLFGMVAPNVQARLPAAVTGSNFAGAFLTATAINFSNGSGWVSMAGDYYVHYPATTSRTVTMFLTIVGISIPGILTSCLGALLMNSTLASPTIMAEYQEHGFGGLLLVTISPVGFSKVVLVILVFSILANNAAVLYSAGLSVQVFGDFFHAVPRLLWSLLTAVALAGLAIAGGEHLAAYIENFLGLLGYWAVCFAVILFLEDNIFRRTEGYNLEVWDDASKLPHGIGAIFALLCGFCAGGIPGMSQTWYTGPIAEKIGDYGGDVGVYMSAAISFVAYLGARYLEKKVFEK